MIQAYDKTQATIFSPLEYPFLEVYKMYQEGFPALQKQYIF